MALSVPLPPMCPIPGYLPLKPQLYPLYHYLTRLGICNRLPIS
uniref:Uncharacterized protein n=1 Tax=Anguilla anguilla TaxID=7936 RepID=A0A0E9S8Y9_ANGAN